MRPQQLVKARLYVMLDALEHDLREMLRIWVVDRLGEVDAAGPFVDRARELRAKAGNPDDPLVDYLYLGEEIGLLNIHAELLPPEMALALKKITPTLDALVPIRNRVMHGRPLLTDDATTAQDRFALIRAAGLDLPSLVPILTHLDSDPAWEPLFDLRYRAQEKVLHNLPEPDFDETGLIGRSRENRELFKFLTSRRFPVVTIVGEGGVGKTALAVKALYDLIDDTECPFEAVLWASAKTEHLTHDGIKQLADAATDIAGLAANLGRPFGAPGGMDLVGLAEAIAGVPALLVIDNVETVDPDEIVTIVDALPEDTRFLLTSRVGLGQLERQQVLKPLDDSHAGHLFRRLAQSRSLDDLAGMSEPALHRVVSTLRANPLSIKVAVLAIEAGASLDDVLLHQDDVLAFCISTVYSRLSPDALLVLQTMAATSRPLSYPELAILSEIDADPLRAATHELMRSSLVERSIRGPADTTQLHALSDSAGQYVQRLAPVPVDLVAAVRGRDASLRTREEQRTRRGRERSLGPANVWTRSAGDKAVATLLSGALKDSYEGRLEAAREQLRRAESLAPDYSEVFRVSGFIESMAGNAETAATQYERALAIASSDLRGVVAFYYSGHISKHLLDAERALPLALEAHQLLGFPETAIRVGEMYKYMGRFEEANAHFVEARDQSAGRTRLIATTNIVDNAKRKAEGLIGSERNPAAAVAAAMVGVDESMATLGLGVADRKLTETMLECATLCARTLSTMSDLDAHEDALFRLVSAAEALYSDWRSFREFLYLESALRRLRDRLKDDALSGRIGKLLGSAPGAPMDRQMGVLRKFDRGRGFGFIDREGLPDIFFHYNALAYAEEQLLLVPGSRLNFAVASNEQGPVAVDITIDVPTALKIASTRTGTVAHVDTAYAFADDDLTRGRVYIPRSAMSRFQELRIGARVRYGLVLHSGGVRAGWADLVNSPAS